MKLNWLRVEMKIEKSINLIQAFGLQLHGDVLQGQVNHHYHNHRCHHFHHHNWYCQRWLTWMTSFTKALSVPILAFFITDTFGPIQVQKTNFDRFDSSSPVCNNSYWKLWQVICAKFWLILFQTGLVWLCCDTGSLGWEKKELGWPGHDQQLWGMRTIMRLSLTMILMYPKPRSSGVKWALKSANSFPFAFTPILLSV